MIKAFSAGLSDRGKRRPSNQDTLFRDDNLGLYSVADGMGGHRGGDMASRLAVDALTDFMQNSSRDGHNLAVDNDRSYDLCDEARRLQAAILSANRKVYLKSRQDEALRGMGTTISTVYLTGNRLIAANVGDSPIYLIRNREIEMLSTPHTLYHEHHTRHPDAKIHDRYRHVLTRSVGTSESVEIDMYEIQCFKDDHVIICSDGLSNKVSPQEILTTAKESDVGGACRSLVELANTRGGEDNITLINLRIQSVSTLKRSRLFGRLLYGIKRWIRKK
jgi:protein phosphatase